MSDDVEMKEEPDATKQQSDAQMNDTEKCEPTSPNSNNKERTKVEDDDSHMVDTANQQPSPKNAGQNEAMDELKQEEGGASTAKDENLPPPNFCLMNPYPRKLFLQRFTVPEIVRFAHINKAYYAWVRAYFAEECRVLSICVSSNKYCLGRDLCSYSNHACPHRIVRAISSIESLIKLGLVKIDTVFIRAHTKPKHVRTAMQGVRTCCSILNSGIRRVFVDVSSEEHYAPIIEDLLKRNDDSLELFWIRNLDADKSTLNFPHFLSRSKWDTKNFPLKYRYEDTKKARRKAKQKRAREAAAALNHVDPIDAAVEIFIAGLDEI